VPENPYSLVGVQVFTLFGGSRSYSEDRPEVGTLAQKLARRRRKGEPLSLRQISAALANAGQVSSNGSPFTATSVQRMLAQ
jgi:hypothetical protein